jgi:hypothetical protein
MSTDDRFRRDDPARTDPVRNFSNTLRPDDPTTAPPDWMNEPPAGNPIGGGTKSPTAGDTSDFVTHGVRLGYGLLHDQLHRGQRLAEQFSGGLGSVTAPATDMRQVMERMLKFYSGMYLETSLLWMDLLFPTAPSKPGPSPDLKPSDIPVTISSLRPTLHTLKLDPGAESRPLEACQLWARDRAKPPLMDAAFAAGSDGKVFLRIRVPDDQPADTYLGVVCDRTTGEPLGTLSVEIRQ